MAKTVIKSKGSIITIEGTPNEVQRILDLVKKNGSSKKQKTKKHTKGKISIMDRLTGLKEENFFNKPRPTIEIKQKLAEAGYHYSANSLTEPLQRAVRKKVLGRIKTKKGIWGYVRR